MAAGYHVGCQILYLQSWLKIYKGLEEDVHIRTLLVLYNANLFALKYDCNIELHTKD